MDSGGNSGGGSSLEKGGQFLKNVATGLAIGTGLGYGQQYGQDLYRKYHPK